MLKPIDTASTVDAIFPGDGEPATVWKLRALTKRTRALIMDEAAYGQTKSAGGVEVRTRAGSIAFRKVKAGLAGVVNFGQAWADEAAPDDVGRGKFVPTDAFLSTIPDQVFDWLAERIEDLSSLQESDSGKSSPPST